MRRKHKKKIPDSIQRWMDGNPRWITEETPYGTVTYGRDENNNKDEKEANKDDKTETNGEAENEAS